MRKKGWLVAGRRRLVIVDSELSTRHDVAEEIRQNAIFYGGIEPLYVFTPSEVKKAIVH